MPQIDKRLYEDSHDGYRYEDMPPDREAFRLGLQAIEKSRTTLHECGFAELGPREQDGMLRSLHDGKPAGRARDLEANAGPPFLDAAGVGLRGGLLLAPVGVG